MKPPVYTLFALYFGQVYNVNSKIQSKNEKKFSFQIIQNDIKYEMLPVKDTASVISSDMQDGDARFTTVPLKAASDQV